jgi:hypothetical protein
LLIACSKASRSFSNANGGVEADTILSEGISPTPERQQVESNEPGSTKDIEPSRGPGQVLPRSTGDVDTGAVVLGIVLWLILFGLGGLILWQNLNR